MNGRCFFVAWILMLGVCFPAKLSSQVDSSILAMADWVKAYNHFGKYNPQEKVYLHLDNTSYYHGDNIWFAAYVVSAFDNRPEVLSRTLYVELLDPGGVVVERRVLPIDKGRCHGEFSLTQLPFRTGYYEVRAYTKYMLNFDSRGIFSRVIPVFDSPAVEGDYADRRLARYDDLKYEMKRPRTPRERNVSMRFYPEGGHLVTGLPSRVAFEATDGAGQPLDVAGGRIVGADGSTRAEFSTLHDGRNTVKVFDTTAGRLVVKRYGHLTMLNRIVYGTLRRSKAERAYLHAFRLRKLGIDTPEAIAFVETRRHGVLHDSYFVSRCSDLRPVRPVTEQFAQTRQGADILDALAFFLLRMHNSGILHNDLNISNILYGDDTGGQYRFQVIDTNRMTFNRTLSMRQRLDNLRRLSCPTPAYLYILEQYARRRNADTESVQLEGAIMRLVFDMRQRLKQGIKKDFQTLMVERYIELNVVDGMILPCLRSSRASSIVLKFVSIFSSTPSIASLSIIILIP